MWSRRLSLAALAAASLAWGAGAGEGPSGGYGSFLDTVEVEVVNVDVVAVDREGRPVTDLVRDDFELLVDDRAVPIDYFSPPSPASAGEAQTAPVPGSEPTAEPQGAAPAAGEAAAPAPPMTVVVYVDQTALRPGPREEALRAVGRFVDASLPPDAKVLVAAFGDQLQIVNGFTADRATLHGSLTRLQKAPPTALVERLEEATLRREIDSTTVDGQGRSGEISVGRVGPGDDPRIAAQRISGSVDILAARQAARQRLAFRSLSDLLGTLEGLEGRKALLLVSGGMGVRPGARLGELWQERFGSLDGVSGPTGGGTFDPESMALRESFAGMLRAAQAARVMVYTVDAGDVSSLPDAEFGGSPDTANSLAGQNADLAASGNLRVLSAATGGRALRAAPGLADELAVVVGDLTHAYSLGFTSGPEMGEGAHRVVVRVRRPGVTARAREGFRRRSAAERAADDAVAVVAVDAPPSNPLGVTVEATEIHRDGKRFLLPIKVKVPLGTLALVPEGDQQIGKVRFQFAIRGADDKIYTLEPREVPITVKNADLKTALGQVYAFDALLPLPPGDSRLAVSVQDSVANSTATVLVPVRAPGK